MAQKEEDEERFGGAQSYLESGAARVNRLWVGLYRVIASYANAVWKYPYAYPETGLKALMEAGFVNENRWPAA